MNEKLYIPKKLNVGFQLRSDTYTGKLGYIIYWDDKGKLRKENSWQSWRHKPGSPKVRLYNYAKKNNEGRKTRNLAIICQYLARSLFFKKRY